MCYYLSESRKEVRDSNIYHTKRFNIGSKVLFKLFDIGTHILSPNVLTIM